MAKRPKSFDTTKVFDRDRFDGKVKRFSKAEDQNRRRK